MNQRRRVLTAVVLSSVAALAGCGPSRPDYKDIRVVIPDGFTGPFSIIADPAGVMLPARDKVLQLEVPNSRVVAVASSDALHEMRRWSLVTTSGKQFSHAEEGEDFVALRFGGYVTYPYPRFNFFVGNLEEFENFDFENWDPLQQGDGSK